ncbi:septation protein A [Lacimicrobium sp. SS2-24]|uniref:septation protein A n=1 Tax=Lacimicrobium sp. SS2-24 TaxID=2005569 RepID=UPI0014398133|nr:septation protein A [Lacimicrobium sp. SS2-24]
MEFLPLLIFFVVYKMQDIFWATGALMLATVVQMLITYLQTREIPRKQWVFLIMILVFGGLTIGLRDEHFIMWKPSIVYVLFAVILLATQMMKRPALKGLLGSAMVLPDKIWTQLNICWAIFFLLSAAANLYVAYTFSESVWVNFKVFGMTGVTLIFTIATIMYAYKYMPEEQTDSANDENKG